MLSIWSQAASYACLEKVLPRKNKQHINKSSSENGTYGQRKARARREGLHANCVAGQAEGRANVFLGKERISCAHWLCIVLHNLHPAPLHSDLSGASISASPCQTPGSLLYWIAPSITSPTFITSNVFRYEVGGEDRNEHDFGASRFNPSFNYTPSPFEDFCCTPGPFQDFEYTPSPFQILDYTPSPFRDIPATTQHDTDSIGQCQSSLFPTQATFDDFGETVPKPHASLYSPLDLDLETLPPIPYSNAIYNPAFAKYGTISPFVPQTDQM
jgi:hypothetical protein